MDAQKRALIASALENIVDRARSGGPLTKVGLMTLGSELGQAEILRGALLAQAEHPGLRVVAIGPRPDSGPAGLEELEWIETGPCEAEVSAALNLALEDGSVAGAVAMHFPFPIGVATIGRVHTPGRGKPMFIASCTGSTAPGRGEALLRNAVYGLAVAKACGIAEPGAAFLNLDGAGPALRALTRLRDNGYAVSLGASARGDGGSLLRGNDLVSGAVDVLVCDTLTGNALMKIFSTYTTGGSYESQGWGYGPSCGELAGGAVWSKIVSIVSRASGAPVVAGALGLTARCVAGALPAKVAAELKAARAAGLDAELEALKPRAAGASQSSDGAPAAPPAVPPAVPVDAEIAGVDVLDLDAALQALWREGVYAESAMGCTGPVVRIQAAMKGKSEDILKKAGFV